MQTDHRSRLAGTVLPEAYKVEGVLTGPLLMGFAISLALAAI